MKSIVTAGLAACLGVSVFGAALLPADISISAPASKPAAYRLGNLRIEAPWMRATPKGAAVAGGYLKITNDGSEADRLLSIASDVAAKAEIHEMSMDGGIMKMRLVDAPLVISPGATLDLKPGGYHVMFTGLKGGVKEGDRVKAKLAFEKAGEIDIEFVAGPIGASGPGAMPMPMHKM